MIQRRDTYPKVQTKVMHQRRLFCCNQWNALILEKTNQNSIKYVTSNLSIKYYPLASHLKSQVRGVSRLTLAGEGRFKGMICFK